jgi:hypothetical protein
MLYCYMGYLLHFWNIVGGIFTILLEHCGEDFPGESESGANPSGGNSLRDIYYTFGTLQNTFMTM